MRDFEGFMRKFKLFWQYPVITEKTFYEQNKNNQGILLFLGQQC